MNLNQNITNPLQRDLRCLDLARKKEGKAYKCCLNFFLKCIDYFKKKKQTNNMLSIITGNVSHAGIIAEHCKCPNKSGFGVLTF